MLSRTHVNSKVRKLQSKCLVVHRDVCRWMSARCEGLNLHYNRSSDFCFVSFGRIKILDFPPHMGLLTLKFDKATQPFLKIDMRHGACRHGKSYQ